MNLNMIISGGQTGVDRAALDAALSCGIKIGGYCPAERRAEDGFVPDKYPLQERGGFMTRTLRNVIEADGTLILNRHKLSGGTKLTFRYARKRKPCLLIQMEDDVSENTKKIIAWLNQNEIRKLNIAGPRESKAPGIYEMAFNLVIAVIRLQRENK